MTVGELISELSNMPEDAEVLMFEGYNIDNWVPVNKAVIHTETVSIYDGTTRNNFVYLKESFDKSKHKW